MPKHPGRKKSLNTPFDESQLKKSKQKKALEKNGKKDSRAFSMRL